MLVVNLFRDRNVKLADILVFFTTGITHFCKKIKKYCISYCNKAKNML